MLLHHNIVFFQCQEYIYPTEKGGNHLWLKQSLVCAVSRTKKLSLLKGTQKKMERRFQHIVAQHQTKGGYYMYKTGEKPGKGLYICSSCGQKVRLDDNTDKLPPCPRCGKTTFRKIS